MIESQSKCTHRKNLGVLGSLSGILGVPILGIFVILQLQSWQMLSQYIAVLCSCYCLFFPYFYLFSLTLCFISTSNCLHFLISRQNLLERVQSNIDLGLPLTPLGPTEGQLGIYFAKLQKLFFNLKNPFA